MKTNNSFPGLLESFFIDRLMRQRQASPNTIASYRDSFCLLFNFAKQHLNKEPSILSIKDLNAPFIGSFLNHIEKDRGNCARSRNVRLAAIHSFFKYIALQDPNHSALIQQVLAIPTKKFERKPIDFLTNTEIDALLAAPNLSTWNGRRDRVLLLLTIQTGLRVSELIGLRCKDIVLGRDGVEYILAKHVAVARPKCPSLQKKRISPHVLRHTAAMELFQHGVDRSVIALWLGHESLETTQVYLQANLEMKEKALAKTTPINVKPGRYQPDDQLLAFLKSL
jgi:integrase/recombinase XerD